MPKGRREVEGFKSKLNRNSMCKSGIRVMKNILGRTVGGYTRSSTQRAEISKK